MNRSEETWQLGGLSLGLMRCFTVYGALLLIFGLFGNACMLATVFLTPTMRKTSKMLLGSLTIADFCALSLAGLYHWLLFAFSINLRALSAMWCQLHTTLSNFAMCFAQWCVCLMALERLVATVIPTHFAMFRRTKTVAFLLLGQALVIGGFYCTGLWQKFEDGKCREPVMGWRVFMWADIILRHFIPCSFLLLSGYLVVRKLKATGRNSSGGNDVLMTSKMTLTFNAVQVLFTIPSTVYGLLIAVGIVEFEPEMDDMVIFGSIQLMKLTNSVSNFFVFMTVKLSFRQSFFRRVMPCLNRKPRIAQDPA